jgi:DNA-binding response OmpR family regulator
VETRDVFAGEERVDLSRLEFDLLLAFMEKPGWVHTYDALAQKVWGEDRIATSHTVTATVSRLKEKLGKAGRAIEAVPGVGYRLRGE